MKVVAAILLIAVALRHGAIFQLAAATGYTPSAVSYMAGGALEVVLALILAAALLAFRRTIWRSLAIGACVIAMIEGAQMTACRLAISDITKLPPRTTLCDFVVGHPVGPVLLAMYAIILCYLVGRYWR